MRTFRLLVALIVCAFAPSWRSAGADDVLAILPSDTAAVVRMASLNNFASGFKEMVSTFGPLAAPAVTGIDHGLSEMFAVGADDGAVDREAPAYLAIFALEGQPEPFVRIVKTSDEARLRRAVLKAGADENLPAEKREDGFEKISKDGRDWFFARRGEWVLYTPREEAAKAVSSFAKPFAAPAADLTGEGQAAVIINIARLIEVYGDKLDEQRDKLRRQIDSLPKEFLGGDSSAIDPRATKKMYADLAELAINAVYDAEWATGRVNFSAAGVGVAALLGIKPDTMTGDVLAANPPANFEALGLLPAGAAAYIAYTSYSPGLVEWNRDWLKLAYGEQSDTTKKLLAALDSITAAQVSTTSTSFSLPSGQNTSMTTVSLTQAKDAEKLRAAIGEYEPAANQQDTPLFSQTVERQADAEKYQDHPVDLLTTHIKLKEVADPGQQIGQKFLEKLFGGDEAQTRLTTVEGMVVKAGGNDPKYLHAAVDALQSGENVLGLDEAYAVTRDQLSEKANIVLLLNAPRLIIDVINLFRTIPPLDLALAQAPINLGSQPPTSYAGVSLGTQPQAVRLDAFIPVSQPQGVLRIFGQ
ncbi:MAG TPA: hypothetical protein VG826_12705 [Pirellulales bacterium]|nr:hypothetical protein [Pirellulales bacterium]